MARKIQTKSKSKTAAKKSTRKVSATTPRGMAKRVNKIGTEWGF